MKRLRRKASGIQALLDIVTDSDMNYLMEYMGSLLNENTDTLNAIQEDEKFKADLEYIKMYGRDFFNRLLTIKQEITDAADAVENFEQYKEEYIDKANEQNTPSVANMKKKMKKLAQLEADQIEHIQTNQILQTLDYPLITQLFYKTRDLYNFLKQLNEQETQDEQDKLEELIEFYQSLLDTQQDVPNEVAKVVELQTGIINAESLY